MTTTSLLGHGLKYTTTIKHPDGRIEVSEDWNLLPKEFVEFAASLILASGALPIGSWHLGIFEGNYVPSSTVKAADLPGVVGECVAYSQAARPAWGADHDGAGNIDNLTAPAVFTMTAEKTLYGGFVISTPAKGGNTGLILSICRFDTPKVVPAGAELTLTAELALTPVV